MFLHKSLKSKHIRLGDMPPIIDWYRDKNPFTYWFLIFIFFVGLILLLVLIVPLTFVVVKNLFF
ncbi:MAG: hypothetical protein V1663_03105 [archaeon]